MFTTRPEISGTFGVVSTTHWLASAVGMATLERGGNAFDAAVAAGMMLQVAEPHLNGPGGDLPAILYRSDIGNAQVLCAQGTAPAAATIGHYGGLGLDIVPGTGLLAAVVPGAFDGWMLMLRDHGTMTLAQVLEPALSYAENGVPLVPRVCDTIAQVREMFTVEWNSSAEVFLPGGDVPRPDGLFAFTIEKAEPNEPSTALRISARYAHAPSYVRGLAEECGLTEKAALEATLRFDGGAPIMGLTFVLAREKA